MADVIRAQQFAFRPHTLEAFTHNGLTSIICTKCGAHSCWKVDHLGYSCLGKPPSRRGVDAINRYKVGLHPHARNPGRVDGAWPIPPSTAQSW